MNTGNPEVWVLADVDDNLISTVRTEPEPGAKPCSFDKEGRVCGFLTRKQEAMMDLLSAGARVVPCTARSYIGRLELPALAGNYAILANGGTILGPDGNRLRSWFDYMEPLSVSDSPVMHELARLGKAAGRERGFNVRSKVVSSKDLDLYVSIKHNDKNVEELAQLAALLRSSVPDGWALHHNGNAIFLMPNWLGKDKAVEWFIANVVPQGAVTIGMGDSLSDLSFMNLCDYALMPRKSQNWTALVEALIRR
jgi:hydroxymethylpyrimidine pyrophosphatase-like HAD family hydrolase